MKRMIRSARDRADCPDVRWSWKERWRGVPGRGARGRAGLGVAVTVGLLSVALAAPAHADCDNHTPGEGETVTCDTSDPNPDPENIDGGGSSSVTVNVLDGARILTMEPGISGFGADDWVVNNAGSVVSSGSASILGSNGSGWEVINSGSVVSEVSTGIAGDPGSDWAIDNSGSISGGDFGIRMTSGSITNHADAEISGLTGVGFTFAANATIDNAGTIIGTGDNAIIASFNTESVELVLRGASVLQGDVELQGGSNTLSLEGGNSEDSNFAGLSQVNVQAGADWTLSGILTPLTSGTLEADVAGTLRLDGLLEGAVQVQADGRLGGTGTVGQTTNDGTVAPGDSIGTLAVDGGYTHAAGATFEVEIEPGGTADLLAVGGAADLQGGTVSVLLAPGDYEPGTAIPILTADGGLTGEFSMLEVDNPDVPLELVHEPENNRVLLVVSQQQEEGADLELGKTATVNEGATVVFTLEAANNGPEDATGVVVVDALPACVEFTEDDCDGTEADGEWTWAIDEHAAGETAACQLTVDASGCAGEDEQTNTAEVSSEAQGDPDPDNNTASAVFEIEPAPPTTTFEVETATGTGQASGSISGGGEGCSVASVEALEVTEVAPEGPAGVELPHGLIALELAGCDEGAEVEVALTLPSAIGSEYWKYGPTPDQQEDHWYTVPASVSDATVTFTIVDGGLGDSDLEANGTIVDPGGPSGVPPVPTLPRLALLMLLALLSLAAVRTLRRSHA